MPWAEKSFGKIWEDQMANDCSGPHPVSASRAYIKHVESQENFQYELFSYLREKWWNPSKDRFETTDSYLLFPYDHALIFVRSYEKAS